MNLRITAATLLLTAACTAEGSDPQLFPPSFGNDPEDVDEPYDEDEPADAPPEPGDPPPPEEPPADNADALDAYILSLGHLNIPPIAAKHEIQCPGVCASWQDGALICEESYFSETDHYDSFIALQPNSPALWPGAVLRSDELDGGFLSPIGVPRAPATFSLSLENLTAAPAGMMEAPSLSSFRSLRNEILAEGVHGATPAQITYEINAVNSKSQLAVKLGAGVDWSGVVDLDAMFDFSDASTTNKYLFDFTQTYYTADLDTPVRPSALFESSAEVVELEAFMGPDNPPTYVQSVSYGRRVLFGIESNEALEVIVASVNAAIAQVVNVDAGGNNTDALTSAKITASVLGGDGDAAVKTVLGVEQLLQFITAGGNYSAESPGVPIAYKLAYLDNVPARLALTSEYPEVLCQ
ncbi:MAG: thiol-activated cytolysin family protein [Myxococcota bacterium]